MDEARKNERVAIIDGYRTPFSKSFTDLRDFTAVDLFQAAVSHLLNKTELDENLIDEIICGCVVPSPKQPNIAREIVFTLGLPFKIPGYTLNRACPSSLQAVINATENILCGSNKIIIAGGVEALSDTPITFPKRIVDTLYDFSKAKSTMEKLKILKKLKMTDFFPKPPKIAENATGMTMGEHAEKMAKENRISREEQDRFTFNSHLKASNATKDGRLPSDIAPVVNPRTKQAIYEDNCIRMEPDLEKLASLNPVFDKKYGSVTAGNACPITDGASAVLMMREDVAKSLGYKPLAFVKNYTSVAIDPYDQLLAGPAYLLPALLEKAKLGLKEIDFFDIHEAFAAQVLSNLKFMNDKKFFTEKLNKTKPLGEVDMEKVNVYGGSISIGHPFGATGTRMIARTCKELKKQNKKYGVAAICAGGAMAGGILLENAE